MRGGIETALEGTAFEPADFPVRDEWDLRGERDEGGYAVSLCKPGVRGDDGVQPGGGSGERTARFLQNGESDQPGLTLIP